MPDVEKSTPRATVDVVGATIFKLERLAVLSGRRVVLVLDLRVAPWPAPALSFVKVIDHILLRS